MRRENKKQEAHELPINILRDVESVGKGLQDNGWIVDINFRLPSIAIDGPDGQSIFMQGEDASDLLDEVPDNVNEIDYILWYLDSAGAIEESTNKRVTVKEDVRIPGTNVIVEEGDQIQVLEAGYMLDNRITEMENIMDVDDTFQTMLKYESKKSDINTAAYKLMKKFLKAGVRMGFSRGFEQGIRKAIDDFYGA